ncbi:putative bifunctional diguanylate cyclase/phosphodiesterase [Litoribrevibacter albus]|uniref:GGDEF domain-containing protein n=1 Tax=Litoribrevibacter albus TaxID=1473156 RepID=A0AA37W6N5_9GAMM|nr:EAL domain-containing protein [Litoribrevibacter albus]GLQ29636.1 GGDEF domain-containing protein [Litoribrevibacter albus]
MTLSKRALFVIFPVVFLSFYLAAVISYFSIAETTRKLEQNRLNLAVTELSSLYDQYTTYAESYLLALTESTIFRDYISGRSHNRYSHITLSSSIEKAIRSFEQHKTDELSFAIHTNDANLTREFFFELSDNPFAELDEQLINELKQLQQSSGYSYIHHIQSDSHEHLIAITKVLDRQTFLPPHPSQLANSVLVTFALEPSKFIELKRDIEESYGATVDVHSDLDSAPVETQKSSAQTPHSENQHAHNQITDISLDLFAEATLNNNDTLHIHVTHDYLENHLAPTRQGLTTLGILFFVVSSLILYFLLQRYITRPIIRLEHELSQVMANQKDNIDVTADASNEIGRLERTFNTLYGNLVQAYQKTKELSEQDSLTKLHNIAYITERTNQLLHHAQEHELQVTFIYIDLDNFKFVNDRFGHGTGDALLKSVAHKLTLICHQDDMPHHQSIEDCLIGRIAGDEFAIILEHPEMSPEDSPAEHIANQVLQLFKDGYHFERGHFPVSASIGISKYPQDGHTLSQLINNADNAMYHAKHGGKNQISLYSEEIANKTRRLKDIEQELKTLNPDDEFYLVYMPLVNTRSRQIDGFEVLIRWISPKLGFVGPDEFIPISESFGLFNKIDSWVAETAFKSYADLKARLGRDFKLSINLSSAQLNSNKLGVDLIVLANQYQVPPKQIQLEMTETLNVEYTQETDVLLKVLIAQGFNIAIDDFGTGYTALLQLIEYPAKMIKLDKTFIDKSMEEGKRSLLAPLINICHSQNLQVTAEGVENEEIAAYLTSIGCDYLQGYYFGKPERLEDLSFDHEWYNRPSLSKQSNS